MRLTRLFTVAGSIAGIAALTALPALPAAADQPTVTGQAYALSANVSAVYDALHLNVPALPLATYPAGADKAVVSAKLGSDPNLATLHVLRGSSDVEHGTLVSHADLADVSLLGIIRAGVLDAECTADADGTHGSADIVDLKLGASGSLLRNVRVIPAGLPTSSTATEIQVNANTPIPLNALVGNLLGTLTGQAVTVVFGEQVHHGSTLTVNALHVHIDTTRLGLLGLHLPLGDLLKTDIVVGQADCTQGTVPGGPGGGSPSSSATSSAPATASAPGGGSTTSGPSSSSVGSTTTTAAPGVANASDNKNLPFTGVAGIVPMIVGALVLIAAGGGLFWFTWRRRGQHAGPGNEG